MSGLQHLSLPASSRQCLHLCLGTLGFELFGAVQHHKVIQMTFWEPVNKFQSTDCPVCFFKRTKQKPTLLLKPSLSLYHNRLSSYGYDIFVPRFRPKNSSFRLPYQRHSSSADCTRELFNGSNVSASLLDCTRKKEFCLGGAGFL